jgi:hypothetical protein
MLSAQREAHGIPGGLIEVPEWSEGCRKHMLWVQQNGLEHDEEPGTPGYTPEGDDAGNSSVLSSGPWEFGGENPWEHAPIHLMQLLGPSLARTGYANGCMYTWPGYDRPNPATPQLLTYPGNGTTGWRYEERAFEGPYTPGERVGLATGALTGPYLYVLAWGVGPGRITAATLTGPEGRVDVKIADNETDGLRGYMPAGGTIIPTEPLNLATRYEAAAVFQPTDPPGSAALSVRWTFETSGLANNIRASMVRKWSGDYVVDFDSDAPNPVVTLTGPGGKTHQGARVPNLARGHWRGCVRSGGRDVGYSLQERCAEFDVLDSSVVQLSRRLARRAAVLTVPAAAVGRVARVSFVTKAVRCRSGRCRLRRTSSTRRVKIAGTSTRLKAPTLRRLRSWKVTVALDGYLSQGLSFEGGKRSRRYR